MFWTIRNKQLSFFAAIISIISFFNLYSQYRLSILLDEFQSNLDSYFTMNQYLIELRSLRGSMNRFIREGSLESLQQAMSLKDELNVTLERVDRQSNTSLETYFLLRALRNGQGVCLQKYMEAIELKQKGVSTSFIPYYAADRIADYLEGYTSQLLNIRLSQGNKSYQALTNRVDQSRTLMGILFLFISLLSIGFAILFTNSLTKPIQRLAVTAERMASGDLNTPPVPVSSKDEVGILEVSFNRMRENIQRMFRELQDKAELEKRLHAEELRNVDMERSLKEAQYLNLQSQINPHFLFNTLNLLSRSADFERAHRTAELVRSLSHLFRYSFRKHGPCVSLQEELDFVEEYLRIQTLRFGNRIRYVRQCTTEVEQVSIPAFTLEPLVENALIYGLEPKEEGGVIRIKISQFRDRIRIRVLDTGLGMDDRLLKELREKERKTKESGRGIGLQNVRARLRIFFDAQEEFKIYSKRGRGTLVWISLPVNGKGELKSVGEKEPLHV
ncbi:MAG: sensor histidine kinase [Spirochaetes bacterium]|nr:sensor histidine kinase [Spirochaetota bacterium]